MGFTCYLNADQIFHPQTVKLLQRQPLVLPQCVNNPDLLMENFGRFHDYYIYSFFDMSEVEITSP